MLNLIIDEKRLIMVLLSPRANAEGKTNINPWGIPNRSKETANGTGNNSRAIKFNKRINGSRKKCQKWDICGHK